MEIRQYRVRHPKLNVTEVLRAAELRWFKSIKIS